MPDKVTVIVVTYNHERYVGDTIKSILNQQTDFSTRIIIADDGSEDDTVKIVSAFKAKYPDKITLLKHENNQGVLKNILRILPEIDSEYFAILDGDDSWVYDLKLQKQVDFLDNHFEYNGIFHDAQIVHTDHAENILFNHKKYYSQSYNFKEVIFPIDVLKREVILPSSSALLRSSALKQINLTLLGDNYSLLWKITCFLIKHSKFYFVNESWSIYNNHKSGISKGNNSKFHLSHIQFLKGLMKDEYFKFYTYEIYRSVAEEYRILLESNLKNKKFDQKKILRKYIAAELLKLWHYRKRIKTNTLH